MIVIERALLLLAGIGLVIVLAQLIAAQRQAERSTRPVLRLTRLQPSGDGHEETQLTVNDQVIVRVSDRGLRQEAYAAELERLEALATRLASALGVSVEFSRPVEPNNAAQAEHSPAP